MLQTESMQQLQTILGMHLDKIFGLAAAEDDPHTSAWNTCLRDHDIYRKTIGLLPVLLYLGKYNKEIKSMSTSNWGMLATRLNRSSNASQTTLMHISYLYTDLNRYDIDRRLVELDLTHDHMLTTAMSTPGRTTRVIIKSQPPTSAGSAPRINVAIISNKRWCQTLAHKLISILPAILSNDPHINEYNSFEPFAMTPSVPGFINNESAPELLNTHVMAYLNNEYIQSLLSALEEEELFNALNSYNPDEELIRNTQERIDSTRDRMSRLLRDYDNQQIQLASYQKELLGLKALNPNANPAKELIDYIKKYRKSTLLRVVQDGRLLIFYILAPNAVWDTQTAQALMETPRTNFLNGDSAFSEMLRSVVVDETHLLPMVGKFIIDIPHNAVSVSDSAGSYSNGYLYNPHFRFYQCLGTSAKAIRETMARGDYIMMYEAMLMATSNLNLTDTNVMDKFKYNYNERENYRNFILKEKES